MTPRAAHESSALMLAYGMQALVHKSAELGARFVGKHARDTHREGHSTAWFAGQLPPPASLSDSTLSPVRTPKDDPSKGRNKSHRCRKDLSQV